MEISDSCEHALDFWLQICKNQAQKNVWAEFP